MKKIKSMKSKERENKSGSILPDFSAWTWILIIGTVVLLLVFGTIAWNSLIKDSTCEDSIVIRNSINVGFLPIEKLAPLACTTKKLCLTESGDNCVYLGKPSKDSYSLNKKINKNYQDIAREQIIDQITEEMYNCHALLTNEKGEPYEFMPPSWFKTHDNYCLICSRIALDVDARNKIGSITYGELYQKLASKKTPDGKSYLEFIHPGWQDWRRVSDLYKFFKQDYPDKTPGKFEDWKIDLSNEKGIAIVAQMNEKGYLDRITGTALVLGGGVIAMTYVGAPLGIAMIGAGTASGVAFWYSAPDKNFEYSPPAVYPGDVETLQKLKCEFEFAPQ